jgi:hypothetical protein
VIELATLAHAALLTSRARSFARAVGFNAGHGAAIWLEGTDVQALHSFDLPLSPYSNGARNLSRALYPGRISFHDGYSTSTLKQFVTDVHSGAAPRCDLWYIDGGHTGSVPSHDLDHAMHSSHNGTIVIMDDCTRHWGAVLKAWDHFARVVLNGVTMKETSRGRYAMHSRPEIPWDVLPSPSYTYNRTGWCAGMWVQD